MKTTKYSVILTIADVAKHGSIEAAIVAACAASDYLASGTLGPSFATSGPGPGWTHRYDAADYARRAIGDGAYGYVDAADGRLATMDKDGEVTWSDKSVVALAAPTPEEIDRHRDSARMMVEALESGDCVEGAGDWEDARTCIAPRVAWRVYCAPDGNALSFCGEYATVTEAAEVAESEPAGLDQSLWGTARAAGGVNGMHAPDEGGKEDAEPEDWYGPSGTYCVVRVTYP